jgi:multidrug resistance efflux pump
VGKRDVSAADLVKADGAVEKAKLDLEYTKITAHFSGRTSRTAITIGNLVNAGGGETLLSTIVSTEPMYVFFDVDERSLLRYLQEDKAKGKPQDASHIKDLKILLIWDWPTRKANPPRG